MDGKVITGDVVLLRYYDHVLFRDSFDLASMKPVVREAIGWLDSNETDLVRIVWERYAEPTIREKSKIRSTGLSIRKCDIVEMTKIA